MQATKYIFEFMSIEVELCNNNVAVQIALLCWHSVRAVFRNRLISVQNNICFAKNVWESESALFLQGFYKAKYSANELKYLIII